jgi:hypothetical protein
MTLPEVTCRRAVIMIASHGFGVKSDCGSSLARETGIPELTFGALRKNILSKLY